MPTPPDNAQHPDLPGHARERLAEMRRTHFFTSDLSVNEFLLVIESGFEPLGLVMGSSIYHIGFQLARWGKNEEMTTLTQALYHARELAMTRMEEEADELGADGIVGVRLRINVHTWGSDVIEFVAIGTAVRHQKQPGQFRAGHGKPFTSDLSGQDFWTLLRAGYRPVGFVMGNCVYHIAHQGPIDWISTQTKNIELQSYTQALYDARELAMERMQAEAQALGAEGIVGVVVEEQNHTWGSHLLEFSAVGTAVVSMSREHHIPPPALVLTVNDLAMPRRDDIDMEASLRRLAAGGLPTRAAERLAEEAGPNRKLFTTDLSVNEFLVTKAAGCEHVSQVMGSSVYHIGKVESLVGVTGEVELISRGHREARSLALGRLRQEAALVGADAVVGVRIEERWITKGEHSDAGDFGGEIIDVNIVGTAVRAPWLRGLVRGPAVTDLSGQDLWALHREGYVPCGFVFDFCRYHVFHLLNSGQTQGELERGTDAINQARQLVEARLLAQARECGAEFVVGSDIRFHAREVKCHVCEINDFGVDVSWFGTAVRRSPGPPPPSALPPLVLGMMPLGKRRERIVEEEDESEELKREAEREEESE